MKNRLLALFTFAMVGMAATASAATYYVSPGTQSTQDGSLATPFNTIDDALDGSPALNAGDVILVGRGNYTPGGTLNVPAGVTLRGGYVGGWGAGAWSASNPAVYASSVTYDSGNIVNLDKNAVLDGFYLFKGSTSWAVSMNDVGARVKNSNLRINYGGIYAGANGVTIETTKIVQDYAYYDPWNYSGIFVNGIATIQNNTITPTYSNGVAVYPGSRAVIRWNQFIGNDSHDWYLNFVYASNGGVHVYQNLFDGRYRNNGTAVNINWNNAPSIIENNNISSRL